MTAKPSDVRTSAKIRELAKHAARAKIGSGWQREATEFALELLAADKRIAAMEAREREQAERVGALEKHVRDSGHKTGCAWNMLSCTCGYAELMGVDGE